MLTQASPYHRVAANLRDNGFHAMPVRPGYKVPGDYRGGWGNLSGWAKYCDMMPPEFIHGQWENWPEAGVCVAHGNVIGLDLDTDRKDVAEALGRAVALSHVRRRGQKGWMGYYRPGGGLDGLTARVRWYDPKVFTTGQDGTKHYSPVVELLLHGTQSVLPPSIHPDTLAPYSWLTPDTLENCDISELPEIGGTDLAALDREFTKIGLQRQTPRKVHNAEYDRSAASDHDLEKPFGRSLNDRAMEPQALDQWWPALDMPKSRQRGPGAWEAVPYWRGSGSGRSVQERNPNLKATPGGIVDFGADRSYTPADVVMAARDCSFDAAAEWLGQFIRAEAGGVDLDTLNAGRSQDAPADDVAPPEPKPVHIRDNWLATPVFTGARSFDKIKPAVVPTKDEYEALIPSDPGPFPIRDYAFNCPGLLGELAGYLDQASATATEAGGLAVALPMLGAIMGKAYQTPTRLRTNIYCTAIGGSGTGKTSLVSPAKEVMRLSKVDGLIGQDRIASGSGLLKMLSTGTARICFLDEFGHMLQQVGGAGAGAHAKQIITEFTQLYSAANTLFTGTAYATQDSQQIDCPHLCLFGMATPDQFWSAFGSSSLEDGSIARYLVFPIGKAAPKEPDDRGQSFIVERLEDITAAIGRKVRGNMGLPETCTAGITDEAESARQRLISTMSGCAEHAEREGIKGGPAILRRVAENAIKIALISAVGRNADDPVIDDQDFAVGHALARWSAGVMISNIASHIADNQHEKDMNAVERFVVAGGDGGRRWSEMLKRFRSIKARDMKEITETLEKEGTIVMRMIAREHGGGTPQKVLFGASDSS
ncbi:MAG: putative bifunctional DNA primase/polymerase [Prokaryotic dsDNA virus sp.]|nr:MAG: putative bifunctional DNA primase/polymerase [Prokaryotic dsDNA virus sp.]